MVRQVREFAVFYRVFSARLKGHVVEHVYVNAPSSAEALDVAKPLLPKDGVLIRADESPSWAVDPLKV
jgi:hypothetical protein